MVYVSINDIEYTTEEFKQYLEQIETLDDIKEIFFNTDEWSKRALGGLFIEAAFNLATKRKK